MKKLFFFVAIFASSMAMGAAENKVGPKVGSTKKMLKTVKKLLEKPILGPFAGTREIGKAFEASLGGIKDLLEAGEREEGLKALDDLQKEYAWLRMEKDSSLSKCNRVDCKHNRLDLDRPGHPWMGSTVDGIIRVVRMGRYDWVDEEKGSQP